MSVGQDTIRGNFKMGRQTTVYRMVLDEHTYISPTENVMMIAICTLVGPGHCATDRK